MMITAINVEASLNFLRCLSSFLHNIHQTNDFSLKVANENVKSLLMFQMIQYAYLLF